MYLEGSVFFSDGTVRFQITDGTVRFQISDGTVRFQISDGTVRFLAHKLRSCPGAKDCVDLTCVANLQHMYAAGSKFRIAEA